MDTQKLSQIHTVIKMPKIKDKENLKTSKRKAVGYLQENSHRLSADFSKETLQARRDWQEISKS